MDPLDIGQPSDVLALLDGIASVATQPIDLRERMSFRKKRRL
jgi:hypothetical protein